MKIGYTILLLFTFCSYSNAQKKVYDESNYILGRVDSTAHGLDRKYFVYKYDTSRIMVISYFFNGKRLMKNYIYKNRLDGPCEMYTDRGELLQKDSFSNGKKIYSKTFYKHGTSLKILRNGKLRTAKKADIDSFLKK